MRDSVVDWFLCTGRNVSAITESARLARSRLSRTRGGQPGWQPRVAKFRNSVQDASLEDLPLAEPLGRRVRPPNLQQTLCGMCCFCDISRASDVANGAFGKSCIWHMSTGRNGKEFSRAIFP